MKTAFVGFSADTIEDWPNYLPEPHAPSNYKDNLKIQEYIEAARDRQAAEAPSLPLTGILKSYCIYSGNSAHDAKPLVLDQKVVTLVEYLNNHSRVACVDASAMIRLARIEWIMRRGELTEETSWLAFPELSSKFSRPFVFDPVARMVGSEAKENTDPFLVARRFLHCSEKAFSEQYTGVVGRAKLAVDLSRILGC